MTHTKRGAAINGDLFRLDHPSLDLTIPFTSHVDVVHNGVTHQVLATADRSAYNYANTTSEFAIGELRGHVVETMDTVETQVAHRYQAIVSGDTGVLAVHSYLGSSEAVELLAALRPVATALGMAIDPDDTAEVSGTPRVALTTRIGVLEVAPLTDAIEAQLPRWTGTRVEHGELFAGALSGQVPWLTLVTPTCRVVAMLAADADPDDATTVIAALNATWSS